MPGGLELKTEVLSTSACTLCGACLDWCPYLKNREDRLVMRFDCNVKEGRCYSVCPRTFTDWEEIRKSFLDQPSTVQLGSFQNIYRARSISHGKGYQNGGTVSALVKFALEQGEADKALLTGQGKEPLIPDAFLTDNADEVSRSFGSRYLAAPGLRKMTEAAGQQGKFMIIGRPCQVQAVRKMQFHLRQEKKELDALVVGLFCLWSLNWSFKKFTEQRFPAEDIKHMAIPRHGIELHTASGVRTLTTEEVRPFIRNGCRYCYDMTSELADLSVGALETDPGWNTLMVRSTKGAQLVHKAAAAGVLEILEYPAAELARLKKAAWNKKRRALTVLQGAFEEGQLKPFIDLEQPCYKAVLEASGEVEK